SGERRAAARGEHRPRRPARGVCENRCCAQAITATAGTVCYVSRNDELERYRTALRRRLNAEFVERWGVCEQGHVLTDVNRDSQGRCWCCTRSHERAFAFVGPAVFHGAPFVGRARSWP